MVRTSINEVLNTETQTCGGALMVLTGKVKVLKCILQRSLAFLQNKFLQNQYISKF